MRINRTSVLSLGLVVLGFAMAAALYGRLPEAMPTHWNARGVADGFTAKPLGPFVMPLMMAGTWLLFLVIPLVSPRGYRVERFGRAFEIVQAAILSFMFLGTVLVLLSGIGAPVPMDRANHAGTGLMMVVAGNFMGKFTKNFFVGIRTPWTLASDEVWLRTHRLGGKLFVLGGLALVVSGLLGGGMVPFVLSIAVAAGVPVVYSYVLYRRIEGPRNGAADENGSHTTT